VPPGAVEYRRLVKLVQEPERHQQLAGAEAGVLPRAELEVGELHGSLAPLLGALSGGGVLELDLRVEQDLVAELVAEVRHVAQEVEALVRLRGRAVLPRDRRRPEEYFAVASDRDAPAPAVDLGGGGPEAGLPLRRRFVLAGLSRARVLQLRGH